MMFSKREQQFNDFLLENNIYDFHHNDRSILNGQELDFYIPDYHLGFEINPSSSHGSIGLRKNLDVYYHQNKALDSRIAGVSLTHIYDWSNVDNEPVWASESFLEYVQGLIIPLTIQATDIKQISESEAISFAHKYDVFNNFSDMKPVTFLGVFTENELVGIMVGEMINLALLDNDKLVYRFICKPNIKITNFWDVWDSTKLLILEYSLDFVQIGIPKTKLSFLSLEQPRKHFVTGSGRNFVELSETQFLEKYRLDDSDKNVINIADDFNVNMVCDSGFERYANQPVY